MQEKAPISNSYPLIIIHYLVYSPKSSTIVFIFFFDLQFGLQSFSNFKLQIRKQNILQTVSS